MCFVDFTVFTGIGTPVANVRHEDLKRNKKMNTDTKNFTLRKIFFLVFLTLFTFQIAALAADKEKSSSSRISRDEAVSIASKGLSSKLKTDLVSKAVAVKFTKAEQYFVSDTEIGLRGEGTCQLDGAATELPINFDVKIDISRHSAEDVRYVFLNMDAPAGLTVEDVVTAKLLEKMKSDFKTENVVVAVDYVSDKNQANAFNGSGEVRLNGMVWKKFSFDAKAGSDINDISISKYSVK